MRNKIINDYKQKKEDILLQSNALLRDLAYRRAVEKSKLKNNMGNLSGTGSSRDLDFFLDNSFNEEQDTILRNRKRDLSNLRDDTISNNKKKHTKIPRNKEDFIREYLKGFSEIF